MNKSSLEIFRFNVLKFFTKKFFYLVVMTFCLIVLSVNNSRADLVEDLIKKHKWDPKNNAKDQCLLMSSIERELHLFGVDGYDDNLCITFVDTYSFHPKEKKWYGPSGYGIIYKRDTHEIIGGSIDPENYYDLSNKEFLNRIKKHYTKYLIDIKAHEKFKALEKQAKEEFENSERFENARKNMKNLNDEKEYREVVKKFLKPSSVSYHDDKRLKLAGSKNAPDINFTYFKMRGCYVEEANITNDQFFNNNQN